MLCKDMAFRTWIGESAPPKTCEIILKRKLGIVSFTELDSADNGGKGAAALSGFVQMVEQFERDTGRVAQP